MTIVGLYLPAEPTDKAKSIGFYMPTDPGKTSISWTFGRIDLSRLTFTVMILMEDDMILIGT
jgi:hypothetical protein